jgi:hypothetical protein
MFLKRTAPGDVKQHKGKHKEKTIENPYNLTKVRDRQWRRGLN